LRAAISIRRNVREADFSGVLINIRHDPAAICITEQDAPYLPMSSYVRRHHHENEARASCPHAGQRPAFHESFISKKTSVFVYL
jgi:hypothetical protein